MALQYKRLGVQVISGNMVSQPIDYSKTQLSGNDFVADSYIQSLKAGVFVKIDPTKKYIVPATAADTPLGVLVDSVDGYANQNMNAQACGLATVLVGGGNIFITDNVADEGITAGSPLYLNANGILTKTATNTDTDPVVATALSDNSAGNKAIVVQTR